MKKICRPYCGSATIGLLALLAVAWCGEAFAQLPPINASPNKVGSGARALGMGGAFIAVGALHLPGERGILQQLADQGFRLTRLY